MCPFLIILCVFVHGINLTSACGDHPVKYVISKIHDGEYTQTEMEQNVITSHEPAYSIKLTQSIKKLCKGLLNVSYEMRYFYINEGLEEIEPGVFEGQRFMDALFLSGNKIKIVKSGTFENLTDLNHIDLSDNEISVIESGAFKNLINLRILNVDGNKLSKWNPTSIINTPKLVTFNIKKNFLNKLHANIFDFLAKDQIIDLSISNNLLDDIHYKALEGLNFVSLNMSTNKLKALPGSVLKNKNIEILDLSFNHLKRLPEEIYDLKNLNVVSFSGNPLDCYTQTKLRKLAYDLNINILFDNSC